MVAVVFSACRFAAVDTSVICHGIILCLGSFLYIARYVLKSLSIGFRRTKFDIFREHVANLHILYCDAGPGYLIRTLCK